MLDLKPGTVVQLREGNRMWLDACQAVIFTVHGDRYGIVKIPDATDSHIGMVGWVDDADIEEVVSFPLGSHRCSPGLLGS